MNSVVRRVDVEGAQLHAEFCLRAGKPPAVFIHGFGSDLRTWDPVWELLSLDRGFLRYDLRGFGKSIALTQDAFHHSEDLEHLLNVLGVDRCDLVGLSMGGSIALNFSLNRPQRVRTLSLLSPGITAWDWSKEWRRQWSGITSLARADDMVAARKLWLAHPLFYSIRETPAWENLQQEIARFSGDQWADDKQAPAPPDLERLHELQAPLLLLAGARDLADFRLIANLIEQCVPDVRRHDHESAGHLLHWEAPVWCRERLESFWREADRQHETPSAD